MTSSRPPRITEADAHAGAYFQHEDGSLWRLVSYAAQPTATLECVHGRPGCNSLLPPPRIGGVVGAPIFEGFTRLVPQADDA